jgi:hypothetical protein
MRPIDGPMRRRDIYALLPPGDRHPLAADMLNALVETAAEFSAAPWADPCGCRSLELALVRLVRAPATCFKDGPHG